jgi:hypothetical protein
VDIPEEKRVEIGSMAILLFLLTIALYVTTLAPSITVGDAGEFCAALNPGLVCFLEIGLIPLLLPSPFGSRVIA